MLRVLLAGIAVALPAPVLAQDPEMDAETYFMVMTMGGCSMTEAALDAEMAAFGVEKPASDAVTADLVAQGLATVANETEGKRITLGPEACTPMEAGFTAEAPVEHVEKVVEVFLARSCVVGMADMAAAEAEAGLNTSDFSMAFAVLQQRGEGELDPVRQELHLINKDCP